MTYLGQWNGWLNVWRVSREVTSSIVNYNFFGSWISIALLVEYFNTNKGNVEFGEGIYVYKKSIKINANVTEAICTRCIKKCREVFKRGIIIIKNKSAYNIKKSCRCHVNNHTPLMNYINEQKN